MPWIHHGSYPLPNDDYSDEYKYALIYQLEHIYIYYITFPREYYEYYYSYSGDKEYDEYLKGTQDYYVSAPKYFTFKRQMAGFYK